MALPTSRLSSIPMASELSLPLTRRIPKSGRDFDLYIINIDGTGQQRITFYPDFDAFPMFTSDGKRLVWASNRNGKVPHETNIFIADWVE